MRKALVLLAISALAIFGAPYARAQQVTNALTVASCASQSLATGQFFPVTMDTTGKLCDNGSGSSSTYQVAGTSQFGLTVATATGLTVPGGATIAEICVETANVRYRDDGTNPTSSTGVPVNSGTCFQYAAALSAIKFIAQSGSPTLDVAYYK